MTKQSRSSTGRSPRVRGQERNAMVKGIYNNSSYMHSATSLVGNTVQIQTQNGSLFEGIFKTFSTGFDVVLEVAHRVNMAEPSQINVEHVVDTLIFKQNDIVYMEATDVDLDYAVRDTFQTDTAISKFNGQLGEKELEPWEESTSNGDDFDLNGAAMNGWDVNEMFKKNEQAYGVTTTFDQSLQGYTVPLQKQDTKEFKEAEAKAAQIANEIENNPNYKARIELENGDEEERFASVSRSSETSDPGSKPYMPPAKRKHQQNKFLRSSPNPPPQQLSQNQPPKPQQHPSSSMSMPKSPMSQHNTPPMQHNPPPFQQPPPQQPPSMRQPPPQTKPLVQSPVATVPSPISYPTSQQPLPQRERINRQMEQQMPKPQKPPSGMRTGRGYQQDNSNIAPRYQSNGDSDMRSPVSTPSENKPPMPQMTHRPPGPSIQPIVEHPLPPNSPQVMCHPPPFAMAAPPPPPVVEHPPPPQHRKPPRPREDTLTDLKKFGNDFKLAESSMDDKMHSVAVSSESHGMPDVRDQQVSDKLCMWSDLRLE